MQVPQESRVPKESKEIETASRQHLDERRRHIFAINSDAKLNHLLYYFLCVFIHSYGKLY